MTCEGLEGGFEAGIAAGHIASWAHKSKGLLTVYNSECTITYLPDRDLRCLAL